MTEMTSAIDSFQGGNGSNGHHFSLTKLFEIV
jgi:hypothetical protein